MSDETTQPLTTVYECWNDSEAEVVIGLLRSRGIEGMANSEIPHSILPVMADGLGRIEIRVSNADEENARAILAEHRESIVANDEDES